MSEWLETIGWFDILTLSLTVIFGVLAIVFFFKGLKVKAPRYAIHSFNMLELRVGDMPLKMLYAGQEIERLTSTKIAFWNAGHETINSQDVAEPITVQVKDECKILDARILQVKNPVNKFSIPTFTQMNVPLYFDYVDKDEGVVIQILHTGKSSEDIEIRGTIKGAGKLTRKIVPVAPSRLMFIPLSFPVWFFVGLTIIRFYYYTQEEFLIYASGGITIILIAMSILAGAFLYSEIRRRTIPKGFEAFREEF